MSPSRCPGCLFPLEQTRGSLPQGFAELAESGGGPGGPGGQGAALWTPAPTLASAPQVSPTPCSLESPPHRDRSTVGPEQGAGLLGPGLPWAGSSDLVSPETPLFIWGLFRPWNTGGVALVASGRLFGASWVLLFGCPCPALRTRGLGGFVRDLPCPQRGPRTDLLSGISTGSYWLLGRRTAPRNVSTLSPEPVNVPQL